MRVNTEPIRSFALGVIWVATAAVFGGENRADDQAARSNPASPNELLLDDLDRELIPQPSALPVPAEPDIDDGRPTASAVAGEDLDGPSRNNALNTIERQMREVQQRLRRHDVATVTQRMQAQIIKHIDALLQESGRDPGQLSQRSPRDQALSPDKQSADASAAAGDSTSRLTSHSAAPLNAQSLGTWLAKTWGHLPARLRTPMLNSGVDKFLPQYQTLIEDYYRRLAEDQSDN